MDYSARYQYMETLRKRYAAGNKQEKGKLLDEYCQATGQDRKYVIKRFRNLVSLKPPHNPRKPRRRLYGHEETAALVKVWEIFDGPCGQRLQPILRDEVARLRRFGELLCADTVAGHLLTMAPSTIDELLKHEKQVRHLAGKYQRRTTSLLCASVPVKTSGEMERTIPGHLQVDFVEHCGASAVGEYVNSLSLADIFSGWWEGDAVMGKGQRRAQEAIIAARERSPLVWKEIHPDNGGNIMNYHLYQYATNTGLEMSRSRPYQKNDNCFVEQKNGTHVRQVVGYLRYDTEEERQIMSDLYRHELRLYKNFCQPVMKLVSKTRVGGKIKKVYDRPRTPYRRLLESAVVAEETKRDLRRTYEEINPAALKRAIDKKLALLLTAHQVTHRAPAAAIFGKKLIPSSVSFYTGQSARLRCLSYSG